MYIVENLLLNSDSRRSLLSGFQPLQRLSAQIWQRTPIF